MINKIQRWLPPIIITISFTVINYNLYILEKTKEHPIILGAILVSSLLCSISVWICAIKENSK